MDRLGSVKLHVDKWQGRADVSDNVFWGDTLSTYRGFEEYRLTLPWLDTPETREYAINLLRCDSPCSKCCQYDLISIKYSDAVRIIEDVNEGQRWRDLAKKCILVKGIGWCIKGRPCPFLENDRCLIYEKRPSVCRDYPIISPSIENGIKKLAVSIRCEPGADLGREMIKLHIKMRGGELTPNLMVV